MSDESNNTISLRVAVIGDRDSVMGFRSLGMEALEAVSRSDILEKLSRVCSGAYGVVFITEHAASLVLDELENLRARRLPAVVPIPSTQGTLGIGMEQVKESVKKAVGVDILGFDS